MLEIRQIGINGVVLSCIRIAWREELKINNFNQHIKVSDFYIQIKDYEDRIYVRFCKGKNISAKNIQNFGQGKSGWYISKKQLEIIDQGEEG